VSCLPAPTGEGERAASAAVVGWGVVVGAASAGLPVVLPWLASGTVYAVEVAVIASVYVGFAVADGRARVLAVEAVVATGFVLLAAIALSGAAGTLWLVALALFLHGVKDLWQHRSRFVRGTRWWPPFCVAVDWTTAPLVAGLAALT
jgi:hypothetical protein